MAERWRVVVGFPDYVVSDLGRIYSNKSKKFLKVRPSTNGYAKVNLYSAPYKYRTRNVHNLVMEAFIGLPVKTNPDDFMVIDHINDNKMDCRLANLRYITQSENITKAWQRKKAA
jgi:NUMOD4 motif.